MDRTSTTATSAGGSTPRDELTLGLLLTATATAAEGTGRDVTRRR